MSHSRLQNSGRVEVAEVSPSHRRAHRFVVVKMALSEGVGFAHVVH